MKKVFVLIMMFVLSTDFGVQKLASASEMWVARYNGPGNYVDMAQAIAVDREGNVYVTGKSYGFGYDYATIKYNTAGVEQWVERYNGPDNDDDKANAIAVDGGYVYVTGSSDGSVTGSDYATIKYNTSGGEQWARRESIGHESYCIASAIAVDKDGNVYVTGKVNDYLGELFDYMTVKYDSLGVKQWRARYAMPGNGWDEARAIAVDDSGNAYVTGSSDGSVTGSDYATIKYNSSGDTLWVRRYNGQGNGGDAASAIALDKDGNIYVTGRSEGSGTDYDYATVKYNTDGVEQWAERYNGPGNGNDYASAIALDDSGNVYVTGHSEGSGTSDDYATIKYNADGIEQWVERYNGPDNDYDIAYAIAVDKGGNVYVTGWSESSRTCAHDYVTIKYSCAGIEESEKLKVKGVKLKVYPNPVVGSAIIKYQLPVKSEISLKIYDITGRIVKTLASEEKKAGSYNVSFDTKGLTTGIYFAKLVVDDYKETKKLILMK